VLSAAWLIAGTTAILAAAFVALRPRWWAHVIGAQWRSLAAALAAGTAAGVGGWLALALWQPMSRATLATAFALLHPFVPTVTTHPETFNIGTRDFNVFVSRQCSGSEGLGLMLVFTVMWLWLHRAHWRFPRALLLVPIGLASVWFVNCLRIAGLVFIGVTGAPEIALGGFHSQAGWIGFNAVAIGICLVARRMPWLTTADHRRDAAGATVNPTATYVLPFLALLAGAMLAALATGTFEWFYAIRVVAVTAVLWAFRERYRSMDWRCGWSAMG
jgi:exosortase/archaeosortase family protein